MMNRGVPSRDKQDRWLSPSTRAMLLAWSFLLGGGWVVTWWLDNSIASLWQNLSGTNPDVRESSDVVRQKKVNTVRRDAESVVNRLESLEHDFNNDGNPEPDVAPSVQAVDAATALASARNSRRHARICANCNRCSPHGRFGRQPSGRVTWVGVSRPVLCIWDSRLISSNRSIRQRKQFSTGNSNSRRWRSLLTRKPKLKTPDWT